MSLFDSLGLFYAVAIGAGGQQPSAKKLERHSDRPARDPGHLLPDRHLRRAADARYSWGSWRSKPRGGSKGVILPCTFCINYLF